MLMPSWINAMEMTDAQESQVRENQKCFNKTIHWFPESESV